MSKKNKQSNKQSYQPLVDTFERDRLAAYRWATHWMDYLLEKSARATNQLSALGYFEQAERAEVVAKWLATCNRDRFEAWYARQRTTGTATLAPEDYGQLALIA